MALDGSTHPSDSGTGGSGWTIPKRANSTGSPPPKHIRPSDDQWSTVIVMPGLVPLGPLAKEATLRSV